MSLFEIDDVASLPAEMLMSQNPRSRATRITPKAQRSAVKSEESQRHLSDEVESLDDDSDDIPCTGMCGSFVSDKVTPFWQRERKTFLPCDRLEHEFALTSNL